MVLATNVQELQRKNGTKDFLNLKVPPEVPKKSKMKLKASKVIKYFLNLLQTKPKRKFDVKGRFCLDSVGQYEASIDIDSTGEFHPLLVSDSRDVTSEFQFDNDLSMSWSPHAHNTFKTNGGCSDMEEVNENCGMLFNESYFEDDYWQDYHENIDMKSARSPYVRSVQSLELCSSRLFEPEIMLSGNFSRSTASKGTPRRRHFSLPDSVTKSKLVWSVLSTHCEVNATDVSEVMMDYNQFMINHPAVGLNIAFDSQLDETICDSSKLSDANQLTSVNHEPPLQHDTDNVVLNGFEESKRCSDEKITLNQRKLSDEAYSISTEQFSSIISPQMIEVALNTSCSSDIVHQDKEFEVPEKARESVDGVYKEQLVLQRCMFTGTSNCTDNTHLTKLPSLESGYNSSDSTFSSETSRMAMPLVGNMSNECTFGIKDLRESSNVNTCTVFQHTHPTEISNHLLQKSNASEVVLSTSSPVHAVSTSFCTMLTPIHNFVSPIRQNLGTPFRHTCVDSGSSYRQVQGFRKGILHSSHRFDFDKSNMEINAEQITRDYQLLKISADFIIDRIPFKEKLKTCINVTELVKYLKSHFTLQISKLSSKENVHTILDYKNFAKKACDKFTPDELTMENCFCTLLEAVLLNRPRIVSSCEDFIFDNLPLFVNSQEYLEAAPELVVMLLGNHSSSEVNGCTHADMGIRSALLKYVNVCKTKNTNALSRIESMFSIVINQRATSQVNQSRSDENTSAKIRYHHLDTKREQLGNIKLALSYESPTSISPTVADIPNLSRGIQKFKRVPLLYKPPICPSKSWFDFISKENKRKSTQAIGSPLCVRPRVSKSVRIQDSGGGLLAPVDACRNINQMKSVTLGSSTNMTINVAEAAGVMMPKAEHIQPARDRLLAFRHIYSTRKWNKVNRVNSPGYALMQV